jgi:hypothetical protein
VGGGSLQQQGGCLACTASLLLPAIAAVQLGARGKQRAVASRKLDKCLWLLLAAEACNRAAMWWADYMQWYRNTGKHTGLRLVIG